MKTTLDCLPCLVRQTLNSVKLATPQAVVHKAVMREVLTLLSTMNLSQSPPAIAQQIYRTIQKHSNNPDPYQKIKDRFNTFALSLVPQLTERIATSESPLETAVRLAIAGNIIDFGAAATVTNQTVLQTIDDSLTTPLTGNLNAFLNSVGRAKRILYLTDNAGEIVFDRLLIEQLDPARVTVGVRGRPIINDATLADADQVGLTAIARTIDNGSDAPGTILEDCSPEFKSVFKAADLIIAKGQGNYETLSDQSGPIHFLLKVKCEVIADHLGHPFGATIIRGPGKP